MAMTTTATDPRKGGRPLKPPGGLDRGGKPINSRRLLQAERLREARLALGLSISRAAELAGLGHSTIAWAERGKNRLSEHSLTRLAVAYGKPVEWLMAGEEPFRRRGKQVTVLAWLPELPRLEGWYLAWYPETEDEKRMPSPPSVFELTWIPDGDDGLYLALYDESGQEWGAIEDLHPSLRFMGPIPRPDIEKGGRP